MKTQNYTKLIKEFKESNDVSNFQNVKIAILSSYTISNLKKPLEYDLLKRDFNSEIKVGGYNLYNQELMNPQSWIYDYDPNFILVLISTRTFFSNINFDLINQDYDNIFSLCNSKLDDLFIAISSVNLKSKILITTFENLYLSLNSLIDFQNDLGINSLINHLNSRLIEFSKQNPNVFLMDFNRIISLVGFNNFVDQKMYYLGKILLSNESLELFSEEISNFINASYGKTKKCIVVDLDNTLWSGVIGEDGIDGIVIDDSPIGSIYQDIQKVLLAYKNNGILLAIVSKNNLEDVQGVFDRDGMILNKDDFVCMKINWELKSKNISEIAKFLNLGLDSFIFLDDNPSERLEVVSRLPQVEVIDFPNDVSNLPNILRNISSLKTLNLTSEDVNRTEMYKQELNRKKDYEIKSVDDYLNDLEIEIEVLQNDLESLDRITQLINKTNQFNLRTQRYTKEEVEKYLSLEGNNIFSLKVWDKYGFLGLTGVVMISKKDGQKHFIDNFLLSCRILSRSIEKQFFYEILNVLKSEINILEAQYVKSKKNSQVENFYESLGFDLIDSTGDIKVYKLENTDLKLDKINWIKLK